MIHTVGPRYNEKYRIAAENALHGVRCGACMLCVFVCGGARGFRCWGVGGRVAVTGVTPGLLLWIGCYRNALRLAKEEGLRCDGRGRACVPRPHVALTLHV